jgi:hypothetical protein
MTRIDYINNTQIKPAIGTATANTVKDIFVVFLGRAGFTPASAAAEFSLVEGKTEAAYLATPRLGLAPVGGRAARKAIFSSYENAKNHATFAA